jgi:hypothetical protein
MPDAALPEKLTLKEAYLAMFLFFHEYWEIGERLSDDIGSLLGSLDPFQDPDSPDEFRTPDEAMWHYWIRRSATPLTPRLTWLDSGFTASSRARRSPRSSRRGR